MTDFGRRAGGVSDHGGLAGLTDDDHSQYHNNARGDARYTPLTDVLHGFVFADMYHQIISGTYVFTHNSLRNYQFYMHENTGNVGDEIQYKIYAQAGAKTFILLCEIEDNMGIVEISLDGVPQGTIDLYSASLLQNQYKTLSVTALTTGTHTLNIKTTGKNGLSSDYHACFTHMRIT